MAPPRGTDPATERRQLRDRQEKAGVDGWLEDVFFGGAEVTLLGLPGLVELMDVQPSAPVKFAGLVAWLTLAVWVGMLRGGRVESLPDLPRKTRRTIPVLLVVYSATLWVGAVGGASAEATAGSALASIVVAVAVPLVAATAVAFAADSFDLGKGRQ